MGDKVIATWGISLIAECPGCNEFVDLLGHPDFWDGRRLDLAEHNTPDSTDVEVTCPSCDHSFKVDLEY
jgi:hypothetical protein